MLLRDGRTAHIRPMQPEDRALLVEFYARVSDQSKYYRFFSPMPELSERDLDRFASSVVESQREEAEDVVRLTWVDGV